VNLAPHALAPGITVEHTAPYAWPWTGALDPSRLALVVAGADPWWIKRSHETAVVVGTVDEVAAGVRRAGGVVVHLHHALSDGAATRPTDPDAPAIDRADVVVRAAGIDGFFGSALDTILRARGLDTLLLAGFGLEAPVHSTLRSANDQGYECLLLTDACAPLDPACRDAAVSIVTMSGGIFGAIGTSTALLDALRRIP